jgi:PAS domain S-box-containing protein
MDNPKSPSVLIVEDEGIVARNIQQTLTAFGYKPLNIASSADEAIVQASEVCPDVVLMDIRIKGSLDGLATAKLLQQRFDVPIVYMTAHADVATIERAYKTQPQTYVLKPIKAAELKAAIELALYNQELIRRIQEREHAIETELAITHDWLRLAVEAARSFGWDRDVKSGQVQWFGDLQTSFGIPSDTYDGHVEDFYQHVHPEDQELVAKAIADAKQSREPYTAEFRVFRADGAVRWITGRGKFYYAANGDAERMFGMAVDITERKQVEEALKKSEEKFSKAFRQSPLLLTITSAKDGRFIEVNETKERITGWRREELIGRTSAEMGMWVDPDQRVELMRRLSTHGRVQNFEVKFRTKYADIRVVLMSAELIEINGEPCILAVSADITDLKRAEATLRESEERFRLVANTAPVMIWMSGVDKLRTYFNRPWLEFTGRSLDAESADGWDEGIHPEDLKQCLDIYSKAFDRHEPFQMEYRLRRSDGEYRWIFDSGVPRFSAEASFVGYIGSAIDITERKLAEGALSMVSRRLIEAHEEERTWIARELHDDIGQRLALLVMNLESLRKDAQTSAAEFTEGIGKAIEQASNLSNDLQALSHRLHSSKLEYLGLAAAAASYCRELSDQHKVAIDLHSENIPSDLSQEISLCVFRVLQEALQNAIKHSGSRRFQVSLSRKSNDIVLTLHDSGIGFDPVEAMQGRGLGLTSMRERLKLVDGELSIQSQPRTGTTIHARVPLISRTRSAQSAQ